LLLGKVCVSWLVKSLLWRLSGRQGVLKHPLNAALRPHSF